MVEHLREMWEFFFKVDLRSSIRQRKLTRLNDSTNAHQPVLWAISSERAKVTAVGVNAFKGNLNSIKKNLLNLYHAHIERSVQQVNDLPNRLLNQTLDQL